MKSCLICEIPLPPTGKRGRPPKVCKDCRPVYRRFHGWNPGHPLPEDFGSWTGPWKLINGFWQRRYVTPEGRASKVRYKLRALV